MPVFKVEVDDETAAAVADLRARNSDVSAPDFWRATLHRGLDMMLAFERTDLARASPEAAEEEAVADAARWAAEAAREAQWKQARRDRIARALPRLQAWAAGMPVPAGDAPVVASVYLRSHEVRLAAFLGQVSARRARGVPVGRFEVDGASVVDRRAARDYVRSLVVSELREEQAKLRDGTHPYLQPGEWDDDDELPF